MAAYEAMAAFSLFDEAQKKAADVNTELTNIFGDDEARNRAASGVMQVLKSNRSITSKAKSSFFVYPIIFTNGVVASDVAHLISKYLEVQYAVFTIMSIGLHPVAEGDDLEKHLSNFAAEGLDPAALEICKDLLSKEDSQVLWNEISYEDKIFKPYEFINDKYSTEATKTTKTTTTKNDWEDVVDPKSGQSVDERHKGRSKTETDVEETITNDPYTHEGPLVEIDSRLTAVLEKNLRNSHPTIFKVKLYFQTHANEQEVHLAVKGNPHFITDTDLSNLFTAAIEKKYSFNRFIKWTTGEIKFFKDFVFHLDQVKRDAKLYAKFGEHPWYAQFTTRKNMNFIAKVGCAIAAAFGFKTVISGLNKYLPIATIVTTRQEIEAAVSVKYGFLLKNDKLLTDVMKTLMLLGVVVYDDVSESCSIWFNGFKQRFFVTIGDMKKADSDPTTELMKFMNQLIRKSMF